jgi:threonine/homoserine/homoserine lactone efflux protein
MPSTPSLALFSLACLLLTLTPGPNLLYLVSRTLPPDSPARLFRMGLLTSVLNPKVAVFYLALFPQFIDATRGSVLVQELALGLLQIAINTLGDLCFVLAAGAITSWLSRRPLWSVVQRWVLGVVLAGIALRLAVDTRR